MRSDLGYRTALLNFIITKSLRQGLGTRLQEGVCEIEKLKFILLSDYMKDGLDLFKQLEDRRAVNKKEREPQKESGALDRQYPKKKRSKGGPEDKLRFKDPW